mmetsp:Transcript_75453/g.190795  ORF Transcript_75453/g.190795 Transcript_75453/m.190795 type:complete len:96 (-) Transcript_75453:11-298(-)
MRAGIPGAKVLIMSQFRFRFFDFDADQAVRLVLWKQSDLRSKASMHLSSRFCTYWLPEARRFFVFLPGVADLPCIPDLPEEEHLHRSLCSALRII